LKDGSSWKAVAADTLGNVLALAGTNGDFTRRTFDPWGNPLTRDASGNLRASTLQERRADYDALPLAWASQEVDPDTGLTHYHFREYSPSLGGWLTRDPIGLAGGYLNLRSYLGNRPADELDVWGEEALTVTAALGALAAPAFGGALVAVTVQGAVDLYNGERSSDEVYYSVAAGGAAAGVVGRFTGNAFAIGAAYGGTSNLTKQLLDEKRQSIHWDEVADDAAFGAVLGKVGEKLAPFAIAGVRRAGAMLPSEIAAQISAQLSKLESALAKAFAKRRAAQTVDSACPKTLQVRTWTPINGPGPLGEEVAITFRGATYTETVTTEATIMYRAYGGNSAQIGRYWTRTPPAGPLQSTIDSALNPAWGNSAEKVVKIRVPSGTRVFEGISAPQGGLLGGGSQVYLQDVNPAWIIP
jgi:RHS repeat-associated protein